MGDIVEEFKIKVITQLERLLESATEILNFRDGYSEPEHISHILPRVIEMIRIIYTLNKCLKEIKEGGEWKWEENTR